MKDQIFAAPRSETEDFSFNEQVAEVFHDMAQRSIPGYSTIINTIGSLTAQYAQNSSRLYDLGCSLGTATICMRKNLKKEQNCRIIAVDSSLPMISRCRNILDSYCSDIPVDTLHQDLNDCDISNASVVVLNFVLQFVDPSCRNALIKKIYRGLNPGGILILSEKLAWPDQTTDDLLMEMYWDFKRRNGYSELEISQKRNALENVLIRNTEQEHMERFAEAGFSRAVKWFQCYNFASFIAVKK